MTMKKKNPPWYETYFGKDYLLIDVQPNTTGEVAFMTKALGLRKHTRLLDAACGYGRHMAPLVRRGIDVYGCDMSTDMLSEAKRRLRESGCISRRLIQCDIRKLPFQSVFDSACNMFNSFGYFDEETDNYRVLSQIASALRPGGTFLLDLVNRDFVIRHLSPKDWFEKDGAYILEKKWFDSLRNRTEIDVHVVDKSGKRTYHHSIRVYSFTEISMLLEAAGFEVLDVFGGFEGEEFDLKHKRMLILSQVRK